MLGFLQEFRAEKAIRALAEMAPPLARVRRGGKEVLVPAEEVVSGDILMLAAGDRVPADGRLLFASALQLEESSLTGESLPSDKDFQHQFLLKLLPAIRAPWCLPEPPSVQAVGRR